MIKEDLIRRDAEKFYLKNNKNKEATLASLRHGKSQ